MLGCALAPAGLLAYVVRHHALAAAFDDVIRSLPRGMWPTIACRSVLGVSAFLTYLFPAHGLVDAPRLRRQLALLSSRPSALAMRRVRCSGLRRVLSTAQHRSYWLCSAFGLPLACVLHDAAYPTVAYSVVAVSLPGCRSCRCCNRILCSFCPYLPASSQEALRAEIVPTPRGGVAFFRQGLGYPRCWRGSRRRHPGIAISSIHIYPCCHF